MDRIDLIAVARLSRGDCSIRMAIALGLGSPMTALTWAAVTERPAAASDDAEASIHGIVVVDRRTRHVEDHQLDLHRVSAFHSQSDQVSDSPSSLRDHLLGQSERERHAGPADARDRRHRRRGVNDHIRLGRVLDVRSVPP